jgi:hypothetical protein
LSNLASGPLSKGYLSQLQALLAYYNKQASDTTKVHSPISKEIDWENWNSRIITKGFVSKVKASHE